MSKLICLVLGNKNFSNGEHKKRSFSNSNKNAVIFVNNKIKEKRRIVVITIFELSVRNLVDVYNIVMI